MSVFAYNPEGVKSWANSIINYLNGDYDSVSKCSKDFSSLIDDLAQPNVWTGPAAAENYKNFIDTQKSLISFINSFGSAFQEAMNSINSAVGSLEFTNSNEVGNISSLDLTYTAINDLTPTTIATDTVRYDVDTINDIQASLSTILGDLEKVKSNLNNKINELDNNSGMWDGNSAKQSKESLSNTLEANMSNVISNFNICISNIKMAAENAKGI